MERWWKTGWQRSNHNTAKGDFSYTAPGDECPVMQKVLERKYSHGWIPGRVTILRTAIPTQD